MKKKMTTKIGMAAVLAGMISLLGCPDSVKVMNVSVTPSETSASISWETNNDHYSAAEIVLYKAENHSLVESKEVPGTMDNSVIFEDLTGLSTYEYTISLQGGSETASHSGRFRTTYSSLPLTMITRDSFRLVGDLFYLSSWKQKVPVIVMMHGHGETHTPWEKSKTMDSLISTGYACATFYFRGHNQSASFDIELFKSLENTYYVGADLEAVIHTLGNQSQVDGNSIGMLGGSMGGEGACVGNRFPQVKASVALGPVGPWPKERKTFEECFPDVDAVPLQTVYYIVSEFDVQGEYNMFEYTQNLYNSTMDPRKLWILYGVKVHGNQLANHPGALDSICSWFYEQMPSPISP